MQKSFPIIVNLHIARLHIEQWWVGVWLWESVFNDFLCCCFWRCYHRMSHPFKGSCLPALKAVRICGSVNWNQSKFNWPASTLQWQRGISPTLWSRKAQLYTWLKSYLIWRTVFPCHLKLKIQSCLFILLRKQQFWGILSLIKWAINFESDT